MIFIPTTTRCVLLLLGLLIMEISAAQTEIRPKNNQMGLNFASCTSPVKIDILKANRSSSANHTYVAKWQDSFHDPNNIPRFLKDDFYEFDEDRVYIRVKDPNQATEDGTGTVKVGVKILDISGTIADEITNLTLKETTSKGVFISEPFMLVSNKIDDEVNETHTISIFKEEKILDSPLNIGVGGWLKTEYDPLTGEAPTAENEDIKKDAVKICNQVETIYIRGFILRREPDGVPVVSAEDFREDIALMNIAWAQCCIRVELLSLDIIDPPSAEQYQDFGLDGIPNTNDTGEGNGRFDFEDYGDDGVAGNNDLGEDNMIHDSYEAVSEPFIDNNGNNAYDHEVNLIDGIEIRERPVVWREERNLMDTYADENKITIEYYVINNFTPSTRGMAYSKDFVAFLKEGNNFICRASSIGYNNSSPKDYTTSAHELGHVLIDDKGHYGDVGNVTEGGTRKEINLMRDGAFASPDDHVEEHKRLENKQAKRARDFANRNQ